MCPYSAEVEYHYACGCVETVVFECPGPGRRRRRRRSCLVCVDVNDDDHDHCHDQQQSPPITTALDEGCHDCSQPDLLCLPLLRSESSVVRVGREPLAPLCGLDGGERWIALRERSVNAPTRMGGEGRTVRELEGEGDGEGEGELAESIEP